MLSNAYIALKKLVQVNVKTNSKALSYYKGMKNRLETYLKTYPFGCYDPNPSRLTTQILADYMYMRTF